VTPLRRFLALLGIAALLLILTVIGLSQRQPDHAVFVIIALAQGVLYLIAVWLIMRGELPRRAVAAILAVAVMLRLIILLTPPFLSDDIYRYIWDGRVEAHGVNPYQYIPVDAHLAALRDETIFPNVNRSTYAPTIYPPIAEVIFLAVTRISESLTVMKAAMVMFEAVAVFAILRALALAALAPSRILIYAWHPLPIWEFSGSGHIDAAVVMFVALALLARQRRVPSLVGAAVACAALVKLFPAVILPALYRRWDWKGPAVFAAVIMLAYLPFFGVGTAVFGFLPSYVAEEGLKSGAGFYLWNLVKAALGLTDVGALPYIIFAMAVLAALGLSVLFAPREDGRYAARALLLAGALTILLSPHYPWYFTWIVTFLCFVPSAPMLYLTVAGILLYLIPGGPNLVANGHRLLVETIIYGPVFASALALYWRPAWAARIGA
jgi:alpha-1,6-mannosyltransferase